VTCAMWGETAPASPGKFGVNVLVRCEPSVKQAARRLPALDRPSMTSPSMGDPSQTAYGA
jgi:hypothetical protein